MRLIFVVASVFGALSIAALVAITFAAVIARYVLGAPFYWTEEVSGFLMIWIVMIGAIACEANQQHLTIDIVERALPLRWRRPLAIVVTLISIALLLFMAWQAWSLGQSAKFKMTQILNVSWFWIDLAVVVGAAGTAAVMVWRLLRPEASTGRSRRRL